MTKWLDKVKGETLVSLTHNSSTITLTTTNHEVVLSAEGDCCSHSWFEHVDDFDAVGGEITEFTNDDPYHDEDRPDIVDRYDHMEYQFMTLKTTKGRVHIEMRNSSNGYYGGYIAASVDGKRVPRY